MKHKREANVGIVLERINEILCETSLDESKLRQQLLDEQYDPKAIIVALGELREYADVTFYPVTRVVDYHIVKHPTKIIEGE